MLYRKTMNSLVVTILLLISSAQLYSQDKKMMKDYSMDELCQLANASYLFNGSTTLTAKIIYTGLKNEPLNLNMLRNVADFFTENNNEVAAVLYYYIYININRLNELETDHFMTMFSDAMYQFGLSKTKNGKKVTTLGDIADYSKFDFDIESLKKHTEQMIVDFKSIENFIKIVGTSIGIIGEFVVKPNTKDLSQLMPENVILNSNYKDWLEDRPIEIIRLEEQIKKMKK